MIIPNVRVPLVTAPPVVAALNSKVVALVILATVAPVGIPVPVTVMPTIKEDVSSIVIVGSLL